MARRVIIVDDSDPRYWDPAYIASDDLEFDDGDDEDGDEWGGSWRRFPTYRPRRSADGIRAVSQRGAIGSTWWSQRFIATLESFGMGTRLTRGRSYARSGQVLSIAVDAGQVRAQVQGSRHQPYRVVITLPVFSRPQWRRLTSALGAEAGYAAALLAGRMPTDIEDVARRCGLELFPTKTQLNMACSCPDWSVPCKHVAAVFYILAESFDADPFSILAWRGMQREPLLAAIRAVTPGAAAKAQEPSGALSDTLDTFWTGEPIPPPWPAQGEPADAEQVLLRRGPTGIRLGGRDLTELLLPAYRAMMQP